ncbi:MAG: relaxase domain-containing protein [Planctomycetes bacterium]|nr:relaxase domain-containing protein [Planctomycetota bacterium]
MTSAAAAKSYYRSTDYYSTSPGQWLGKGAELLGLTGATSPEQFDSLADNLDPRTGKDLTVGGSRENRRVGLDMTFNSTKSVGIARELAGAGNAGDPRIEAAHREAVAYTMGYVEKDMQARVRVGGANGNRTTGNMVAYRVTHRDTRISAEDQRPDMSLHDHVFVFNATFDPVEDKWKAAEIGEIKHDSPWFEAIYHNRLAANLRDLGYGIRREGKAFEVAGISREMIDKFSRRRNYIKMVAEKLGITSPGAMAKLGATTRLGKAKELADDLNGYYVSRLTQPERQQLAGLEGLPSYASNERDAVQFAMGHLFERRSVVEDRKLYETAIRHGIGSVTPEGVIEEAKRQGVLLKNGEATTKDVLGEESRIIAFARDGRGTMRPLGKQIERRGSEVATLSALGQQKGRPDESKRPAAGQGIAPHDASPLHLQRPDTATLSPERQAKAKPVQSGSLASPITRLKVDNLSAEQSAMVNHVLGSPDRVVLVIGDAGTGKTHAVKSAFASIDRAVEILAPGAEASRGVLRREGFSRADTVASFLASEDRQAGVANGVIWVDEAGQLPIRDLSRLVDVAKDQNARLVLQGDPKQHRSVARDGDMLNVLQEFAGLPVGRLKDIRRQHGQYKQAVAALAEGDILDGYDKLVGLGWVKEVDGDKPLVDDYLAAVHSGKSVLVVAPTHVEGERITEEIRERLKEDGRLKGEERDFVQLRALGWTDAEKGDVARYDGTEVLQYHRNSGTFKAGDRVRIASWNPKDRLGKPEYFSVLSEQTVRLAEGDAIRITANGKDITGTHRLDNGSQYTVAGFTKEGDIALNNGWVVSKAFGHLTHGYVATSHASQGKTVDRVLIAMGSNSVPAINSEQFYVSVSRGREKATVYSDLAAEQLRAAIQRHDARKSATELMTPKPKRKRTIRERTHSLVKRVKDTYERLRDRAAAAITERQPEREIAYVGR